MTHQSLTRQIGYQIASCCEQIAPIGVVFWLAVALAGVVLIPFATPTALVAAITGVLSTLYLAAISVAAHRLRIVTQPPSARPATDLREVADV